MNKRVLAPVIIALALVILIVSVVMVYYAGTGKTCRVKFLDADGKFIKEVTVAYGKDAADPTFTAKQGEVFFGWDSSVRKVTTNKTVKAVTYKVTAADWNFVSTSAYDKDDKSNTGKTVRMKDYLGEETAETVVFPSTDGDGNAVKAIAQTSLNADSVFLSVKTVVIPYGVVKIELGAFSGCTELETVLIPETVKEIDRDAFKGCISLKTISLPSSLKYLYGNSFEESAKTTLTISEDNENLRIFEGNVVSYDGGTLVAYTNYGKSKTVIGGVIHTIGERAFYSTDVREVVLPETVRTIEKEAFYGCSELTSLSGFSSLETIGDSAFGGCGKLSEFAFPSSVVKVGTGAFSGTNLTRVVLPAKLTNVGQYAFGRANGSKRVTVYTPLYEEDFRLAEDEWASGNPVYYGYDGSEVPITFAVSFVYIDENGKECFIKTEYVEFGKSCALPKLPTIDGKSALRWNATSEAGKYVNPERVLERVEKSIKIYAEF